MIGSLRSIANVECLTDSLEDSSVLPGVNTLGGVDGNETFWSNSWYYEEIFSPPKGLKTPLHAPKKWRGTLPSDWSAVPNFVLGLFSMSVVKPKSQ